MEDAITVGGWRRESTRTFPSLNCVECVSGRRREVHSVREQEPRAVGTLTGASLLGSEMILITEVGVVGISGNSSARTGGEVNL